MGITALSGPWVVFGNTVTSSGGVQEYNEERAPSMFDLGHALADPRGPYCYKPGSPVGTPVWGHWNSRGVVDAVPTTVSTNVIVATQVSTAASGSLALTLMSAAVGNITPSVTLSSPPEGGAAVTGLVAIDSTGAMQSLSFGSGGTIKCWDPRQSISRCLTVSVTFLTTSSSYDNGTVYTIAGRDLYGQKMTETITGTTNGSSQGKTYTGQKAFKYISGVSVTPSSATYSGSTGIIVGVSDTYGFPLRVDQFPYVVGATGVSSGMLFSTVTSSNFIFASSVTATTTTADVRGVYTSSVASSTANAIRFFFAVTPSAQNMQTMGSTNNSGLFGVTQFSSV